MEMTDTVELKGTPCVGNLTLFIHFLEQKLTTGQHKMR